MPNSSITLQNVVDYARTIPELMPVLSVGGLSQQPALSIANRVMAAMVSPSMNWKWNRMILPYFYTNSLQQDYAVPQVVNLGWIESAFLIDINNTSIPKPLWPMEAVRTLPQSSWQWGRVGQVAWLPNNQLVYGTWAANTTYQKILGTPQNPGSPLTQIQDPNGNYWVVSNNLNATVTTGSSQPSWPTNPTYATPANPTQPATTVTDGSVVWTALNPAGQGFRVYPLPPISGLYYEVHIIGQKRPPLFTALSQTLEPIPDDYYTYFQNGFVAYAYEHSKDKEVRTKSVEAKAEWLQSMAESLGKSAREREDNILYPTESLLDSGYPIYVGPANPYYPGGF